METFAWSDHFITGEAMVDAEHRELFRIINEVGTLHGDPERASQAPALIAALVGYAATHFAHEEGLMRACQVDTRHSDAHARVHAEFARQVTHMQEAPGAASDIPHLLRFLTQWLAFHILGTDQAMARQVTAIRNGMTPAEAYDEERRRVADPATASLLQALNSLYSELAERNRALLDLNRDLEARVEARTQAYLDANQRLSAEHDTLKATLQTLETTQRQLIESERKRAALDVQRRMQSLLSQIVEGDPVPTLVINAEHRITHWNKACAVITGLPASEMLGTRRHWEPFYPSERPLMADLIVDGAMDSGVASAYSGKWRPSGIIAGAFEGEDFFPQCGEGGRWLFFTAAPLRDADGRVIGAIETLQDVTERRHAEEELRRYHTELEGIVAQRTGEVQAANVQLRQRNEALTRLNAQLTEAKEQLIQSDKLASIGQLAAGVAHEINNPIGYVHSNIGSLESYVDNILRLVSAYEAAEDDLPPARRQALAALKQEIDLDFLREDFHGLVGESKEGITRVKKIVQDLKDFSRVDSTQEWTDSDLHQGLDSTINIVANEVKYKADVIREYGNLPLVRCLPSQLNQVFMNLLINAAHAIGPERGRITLRTGLDGDRVWLVFEDNGSGIPEEIRQKIFDPFFTTKPVGKGTGLGLSLAYGIVAKHQGSISVQSEVGKGTTFRIELPVQGPDEAQERAA